MSRRRARPAGGGRARVAASEPDTVVDRIVTALERWPDGMHDLGEPRVGVPLDWPPSVVDVYLAFDGGRLFGDTLSLVAIADAPTWALAIAVAVAVASSPSSVNASSQNSPSSS